MTAKVARSIGLAAIGGAIGFVAESVHLRARVWTLPEGAPLPVWIAAVYFAGILGANAGFGALERRISQPMLPTGREVGLETTILLTLFAAPAILHAREVALAVVVAAYLAARLVFCRRLGDLMVAAGFMVGDAAIELGLVHLSLFRYTYAAFTPLPLWLAPLWGGLGLSLRRLFAFAAGSGRAGSPTRRP
ncbi:MAG: DUF2878 family protein [Nitrospirae bacterium]|nr:DUF2878 family protein [Nitrospirota bacterium]